MKNNNYFIGTIGALLGGLLLSTPWILMYVYGNMILSVLAFFIAWGAIKGYQIFKGKVDHHLPTIITVTSLVVVTIATLVIIPLLILKDEGYVVNLTNLSGLYAISEFKGAIIKDYIISLIFTALGISGIVRNIKNQIYSNEGQENIELNLNNNFSNQEEYSKIRSIFEKYHATDKYTLIDKKTVLKEMNTPLASNIFNELRIKQIILKKNGKYYYSIQNEQSSIRRFGLLFGKIMLSIIIFMAIILILVSL